MGFVDGIVCALLAPLIMATGFVIWDKLWTGSAILLNIYKSTFASILFLVVAIFHRNVLANEFVEFDLASVMFLILSSVIGIAVGDNTWLAALKILGTKRTMIVDSIKPFVGAILSAVILNEPITFLQILGVSITMAGVLMVSLESEKTDDADDTSTTSDIDAVTNVDVELVESSGKDTAAVEQKGENGAKTGSPLRVGYAYAVLNVILDVYGAVLTKQYGKKYSTFEINFIRFGFAGYVMGMLVSVSRCVSHKRGKAPFKMFVWPTLTQKQWGQITLGAFLVTFCCPSLSIYAFFQLDLAVVMTLMALGPVYSVPVTWYAKNEKVTLKSVAGSILAFGGVIPLYLSL
jgi:drug/metabolite transporter (DMT)-like permease